MSEGHDDEHATKERAAEQPAAPAEPAEVREAELPSPPADTQDHVGETVMQRYTLEEPLGVGALGSTFRARRKDDGSAVTLKLVDPKFAGDENFMRRLRRDVEAAQKLEHKHIAHIYEQGEDPVLGPFVCREFVDGVDLISALDDLGRTPRSISELLIQALSALSEAHRHGVVHRDLKPTNVLVLHDAEDHPQVKLCDFGQPRRERAGSLYLAPEQGEAGDIDGRADVYAAGVLLYECITDDVPFRGATPAETMALKRSAPLVPPSQRRPELNLPRDLEQVCLKALARVPEERHRSPREMSQALRAVLALLGPRADQPFSRNSFVTKIEATSDEPEEERLTMPGEQLRSHTKFWLGAGLLAAVCVGVLMNPQVAPNPDPLLAPGAVAQSARSNGELALERGIVTLRKGDAPAAIPDLRNARRALGDRSEVLRPLGEALILHNEGPEGAALLKRYLELDPQADDAPFVRSLIERVEPSDEELAP